MYNKHIVICTGGQLDNWALPYIHEADFCIGADKGALFLIEAGIRPFLSIGDFDSVTATQMERIKLNSEHLKDFDKIDKDYTDTELALHEAIALKPTKITIVGGLGTRFDHSIANIQLLALTNKLNIDTQIIDNHNKLILVSSETIVEKERFPYLSILPFTDYANGIDLLGFQYPLHNATIIKGQGIGISNIILDEKATIKVKEGILLVIQSTD